MESNQDVHEQCRRDFAMVADRNVTLKLMRDRANYELMRARSQHGAEVLLRAVLRAQMDRLAEAAEKFLDNACRPGDDGKYDDLFDEARSNLRKVLKEVKDAVTRPAANV